MSEKMTSGEIAKKVGISQKAVRLYDQKGLLKPTGYSEGNYRLYDKEALIILEKIIALKQVGFSLEEIRDRLNTDDEQDIETILQEQVRLMEEKKYQLEKSIQAINRTLERKDGTLNWDDAAEIIRLIGKDQSADERRWDALKHTGKEIEWYVRIFNSLALKENSKVLDLGCGYAELWRKNWSDIPKGVQILGYDLHGTWADDFVNYIDKNKKYLPENVNVEVEFMDIETDEAWKNIPSQGKYDCIIAHYINDVLQDKEKFFERVSGVLSETGMFSFNGANVNDWSGWLKGIFDKLGLESDFLDTLTQQEMANRDTLCGTLCNHFGKVESVLLPNTWHYEDAEDLYEKILRVYPKHEKNLRKSEKLLLDYLSDKIAKEGEIVVTIRSQFWHCFK